MQMIAYMIIQFWWKWHPRKFNRFKGSTLQVMGVFGNENQWAICGGTGEFALAHGIIKRKIIQGSNTENTHELHVHVFYTKMNDTVVGNMFSFLLFCS